MRLRAVPQPISSTEPAGRRRKLGNQPIAPEQVIFAGQVVDEALMAIDAIQVPGVGLVGHSLGEHVEVEAAVDGGSVAGAQRLGSVGLVAPVRQQACRAGDRAARNSSAAVRKITRAPGRAVRVICCQRRVRSWLDIQSWASSRT